jgi:hypothetical protein
VDSAPLAARHPGTPGPLQYTGGHDICAWFRGYGPSEADCHTRRQADRWNHRDSAVAGDAEVSRLSGAQVQWMDSEVRQQEVSVDFTALVYPRTVYTDLNDLRLLAEWH